MSTATEGFSAMIRALDMGCQKKKPPDHGGLYIGLSFFRITTKRGRHASARRSGEKPIRATFRPSWHLEPPPRGAAIDPAHSWTRTRMARARQSGLFGLPHLACGQSAGSSTRSALNAGL